MHLNLVRGAAVLKMPYYAIRSGRTPGVYSSWAEAQTHIAGFKGAVHKKFNSQAEADAFVQTQGGYKAPIISLSDSYPSGESSSTSCAYSIHGTQSAPVNKAIQIPQTAKQPVPAWSSFEYQQHIPPVSSHHSLSSSSSSSCRSYSQEVLSVSVQRSFAGRDIGKPVVTSQLIERGSHVDVQIKMTKPKYDLVMYTDGACKGNNNVEANDCPAGLGVVVLNKEKNVIEEIYAPVELSRTSPYYMGAHVKSNNTAELSAIGEALMYARDMAADMICPACAKSCTCARVTICIRYDSEYAAKTVMGEYNGEKNKPLYENIREVYREVIRGGPYTVGAYKGHVRRRADIVFEKVKGHSGDIYNDRADALANKGASGLTCRSGRYRQTSDSGSSSSSSLLGGSVPPPIMGKTGLNREDDGAPCKLRRT